MKPKDEYLNGIALIVKNDDKKRKKKVVYFPESELTDDINDRFKELFRIKDKWTYDEIEPYIT